MIAGKFALINHSNTKSLADKHEAYREIIANYPDMEIAERLNHSHIKSFHKSLAAIIEQEKRELDKFLCPEPGAVYQGKVCIPRIKGYSFGSRWESYLFSTYANTLAEVKRREADAPSCIKKRYIGITGSMDVKVSKDGVITEIYGGGFVPHIKNYETNLLKSVCIDVPVPFKHGDLVEAENGRGYGFIYVLKDICLNAPKLNARLLVSNDTNDMTADIFYEEHGFIHCECMHFYPDLQYCKRALKDEEQILKYVSQYLRNEICLCDLLLAQRNIRVH